jgi:hypothetical protein
MIDSTAFCIVSLLKLDGLRLALQNIPSLSDVKRPMSVRPLIGVISRRSIAVEIAASFRQRPDFDARTNADAWSFAFLPCAFYWGLYRYRKWK